MLQSRCVLFENFVTGCACVPKCRCLWYPSFSTFKIPCALSSCDFLCVCTHHNGRLRICSRICGGSVLGFVSPALPDDPDSPSTSRSVNGSSQPGGSCFRSPEAVGVRGPPDAASASLRGLVSTTTAGMAIGTPLSDMHSVCLPFGVNTGNCPSLQNNTLF